MGASTLAEILAEFLKKRPDAAYRLRESKSVAVWRETVGPLIAKHTEALTVKQGILTVAVDQAVWKSELFFRRREIVLKLNEKLGEGLIKDLHLIDVKKNRP